MEKINWIGQDWLRSDKDPNEIHVYATHCEMVMYFGRTARQMPCKVLFDLDLLDQVRDYRWTISDSGYCMRDRRNEKPRILWMHHLVLSRQEGIHTDHINGNTLDNRKENLRYATNAQNQWNSSKVRGIVPIKGVHFCKSRGTYQGYVRVHGVGYNSKDFSTPRQAAEWVRKKREQLHGEFANHGN